MSGHHITLCSYLSRRSLLQGISATVLIPSLGIRPAQASSLLNTIEPEVSTSPSLPIITSDGSKTTPAALATMPLLINFWASWCPPCVHELPDLAILDKALRPEGMAVLLIGIDNKPPEESEEFLNQRGVKVPLSYYDPTGEVVGAVPIRAMPTSLLVQKGGKVVGTIVGPREWSSPPVIEAVKNALK